METGGRFGSARPTLEPVLGDHEKDILAKASLLLILLGFVAYPFSVTAVMSLIGTDDPFLGIAVTGLLILASVLLAMAILAISLRFGSRRHTQSP